MAYFDEDHYFPLWTQDSLPEDILVQSNFDLGPAAAPAEVVGLQGGAPSGYIIVDWFGPFLLSPPSRFLRGRC